MLQIEELSKWLCLYCNKENDHTNPTRCWNCNKKKPKLSTVKRILKNRKKAQDWKTEETKKEIIAKIENIQPKPITDIRFDLSELESP